METGRLEDNWVERFGNGGMEIEEWRDVTLWGGQALTLTFLFSTSSLPLSLPHSLSWTSKDKEVRTPLSVSKTPHFETHLKWLLCLWRRIVVSVSLFFYTNLHKRCLKLTDGSV